MKLLLALQELCRQFPKYDETPFHFSAVEKFLQKYFKVTKAVLLIRERDGLRDPQAKTIVLSEKDPVFRRLDRLRKPWIGPANQKWKWAGFWPIMAGKEWIACYGMGPKVDNKKFTDDEKAVMELLADRTSLLLQERRLLELTEKAGSQSSMAFLSSAMVHEIRNPLTAMGTLVQLLPQKKDDGTFLESFQKLMLKEINHLTRLTETFLEFSKTHHQKMEWMDLSQVVGQVAQLVGPLFVAKKVQLKVDTAKNLYLHGNEDQIEILVMNLLQNAFQSVGSGGMIDISASFLPKGKGSGPWLELKVRDNGMGISKENIKKIFGPYFSTKGNGAGLGLALCQKVIENHRGKLSVQSPVYHQKGALFKVLLPTTLKT